MDKLTQSHVLLIPFHHNILKTLCQRIIEDHKASLPDLTHITILLSDIQAASQLRQQLLQTAGQHGFDALLGPHIQTLTGWVDQHYLPNVQVIGNQARELMLVEALLDYPDLYGAGSPWLLAANLLELFDELTRHHVSLPDSLEHFVENLGQAYGLPDASHTALGREAMLVHTLWQAMQQQLHSLNFIDQNTAYLMRLSQSVGDFTVTANSDKPQQFYLAGLFDFIPAEIQWLNLMLAQNRLTLITQAECLSSDPANKTGINALNAEPHWLQQLNHPVLRITTDSALAEFIQQTFAFESQELISRATAFRNRYPASPAQSRIATFAASSDEEEALAVDLQIRQWLIEGRQNLTIVTDNRRLARRVRALLERANVMLDDAAGWALSTTSAATVVERWLETVEQNFHYEALLDFLKSPFVCLQDNRKQHLSAVYRFEKDVVIRENIASGLQRYLTHIDYRSKRLDHDRAGYYDAIVLQLTALQQAAAPLQQLLTGEHQPATFVETLQQSLTSLAVTQPLAADDAGQRVVEEFQKMILSCAHTQMTMDWSGFRYWLGETLERYNFKPSARLQAHGTRVQLLSLAQSDGQQFDAVVIGAAEQEFLPGSAGTSPFFNDTVRTRLGIPARQQQRDKQFAIFRRLLENGHATTGNSSITKHGILVTRRHNQNDEEISPSPWLEALQTFHQLSYGNDLTDATLSDLLQHPGSSVQTDERPLPSTIPEHPATPVPTELLPEAISATAYQALMNCPYQFFAASCLKLSAPDTVREQMEKDEYGQRVHLCLEAFHKHVPDLPGPFEELVTEPNRDAAVTLLEDISRKVFSRDIENNFLHRGWLKQWLDQIPFYIDWQMKREQQWRVLEAEQKITNAPLSNNVKLRGILDRVDCNTQDKNQLGIVDYKTGSVPAQDDVDKGEAVQLPCYALMIEAAPASNETQRSVNRVEYLALDRDKKKFGSKVFLEGEALHDLGARTGQRLNDMMHSLQNDGVMPAWGDPNTCQYCRMGGLCRKQLWDTKL